MKSIYDECPFCHSDLRGEKIPKKYRQHYAKDTTHYSRLIGIEDDSYDGVSFWKCPDCKVTWDRFTGGKVEGM